ncbi:unnamed protein product [Camellia sinensis]
MKAFREGGSWEATVGGGEVAGRGLWKGGCQRTDMVGVEVLERRVRLGLWWVFSEKMVGINFAHGVPKKWGFQINMMGPFSSPLDKSLRTIWFALDHVIAEARQHGVRLLLSLVNNLQAYGGKTQYVKWAWEEGIGLNSLNDSFFFDPSIRHYFKNHVKCEAQRTDLMTITRHVLNEQSKHPEAHGDFTILLSHIVLGCKFVCNAVTKAGLAKLIGLAGQTNTQAEEQKKLDVLSNDVFVKALISSGCTISMANSNITFKDGYTISTVINGHRFHISPRSILPQFGSSDLVILNLANSAFYIVSFSKSKR